MTPELERIEQQQQNIKAQQKLWAAIAGGTEPDADEPNDEPETAAQPTLLTTEQIAELKARPESEIPEWETPSHEEIDLATVKPEDLGLDGWNFDDPLVRKIYEAQTAPKIVELLPSVPAELKQQNRWLTWSGDPGNKQPFISGTTRAASTNNPEHLVSFETAALNIEKQLGYSHLGFVPTRPYYGIDLDSCRDPQTGKVQWWAEGVLGLIDPTYTEITPSLSGLRPWVKLDFEPNQKKYLINPSLAAVATKAPNVQILAQNYGTITGEPYLNAPSTIT